jgi:hypothetical protein
MADTETKIKPEEEAMEGESENNDEVCQVYECAVGGQWCAGSRGVAQVADYVRRRRSQP